MSYRKDSVEILYKNLPDIYREKDKDQNFDLYNYLSAFGLVLDKTRHTLEQRYVDSFPDGGEDEAPCQDWLVPYFADLFAVELRSPTRHGQRNEVSNAVRWAQRKGTLGTAEEIIEAISLTEGVVQEGWQRVATTARIGIPVPDAISMGEVQSLFPDAGMTLPTRAAEIASHPGMPNVTPHVQCHSRVVETDPYNWAAQSWSGNRSLRVWPSDDSDPYVLERDADQIYWRQIHPHGVPCFMKGTDWGDTYQDVSVRTPDTRTPKNAVGEVIGGFHPKRLIAFLPSPEGICVEDSFDFTSTDLEVDILDPLLAAIAFEDGKPLEERRPISEIIEALELNQLKDIGNSPPHKIRNFVTLTVDPDGALVIRNMTSHSIKIDDPFVLTDDIDIRFEKLRFTDTVTQNAGRMFFYRCAIKSFVSNINDGPLSIRSYFQDCLIDNLTSQSATIQCEYVTVLNGLIAQRLLASDCIFATDDETAIEPGVDSCVRYSRILPEPYASDNRNTPAKVIWADNAAEFCQSGCAVLASDCPDDIRFGAEDGGEMGVHHAWYLAAQDEALTQKLKQYLPIGIEPVIVRDRTLQCRPRPVKPPPTE